MINMFLGLGIGLGVIAVTTVSVNLGWNARHGLKLTTGLLLPFFGRKS